MVPIRFAGKSKKLVLREWTDIINKEKQTQAIIPNIIHSLDANHWLNIVNTINKSTEKRVNIISIHNCFGSHPNDMEFIEFVVRKEFILLYSQENFLEKFHNRFLKNLKDNNVPIIIDEDTNIKSIEIKSKIYLIPELPKLGKLDLDKIIDAKYMIT